MPLIGISKYVRPETRHLIDAAWDDAWRELKKGGLVNAALARRKLASTIVTLRLLVRQTPPSSNGLRCMPPEGRYKPTKQPEPGKGDSRGAALMHVAPCLR